jgi:hypothetical protein
MADERIDKWTGWIEGTIKNNVFTMYLQRHAWHITEIGGNAQHLTRTRWLGLNERDEYWMRVAEEVWSETYAGEVGGHLDPAIPAPTSRGCEPQRKKQRTSLTVTSPIPPPTPSAPTSR